MSYIGAKELKASDIRRFDVTGSTSATHTLTWTAPTEQSLIVTINGVKQQEDDYSVSGTTLTLTSALISTDKLEVIGINDIGTTITPAQNSVTADTIADGAVTTVKMAIDPTDASNLASGTVPTARLGSGTADSSVFLRGDQSWATAGGDNTPSFAAYNDAAQSIGSGAWTKLIFNTESWDTDSAFDSSTNYRWTPGETGKYLIWSNVYLTSATYGDVKLYVYKNGSSTSYRYVMKQADGSGMEVVALMSLSSTDYVEMYLYAHGGTAVTEASASHFGGFKLVGV